ncbi:hypothetical protein VTJ49DRAFT_7251 [Mycothermus thermophilus]|uniref:Golgi apparatus membrane protein TVP38 n=1 Tax=Humicola insolens TaxID=85995 RepID=A0ABR3VK73_HUMIN
MTLENPSSGLGLACCSVTAVLCVTLQYSTRHTARPGTAVMPSLRDDTVAAYTDASPGRSIPTITTTRPSISADDYDNDNDSLFSSDDDTNNLNRHNPNPRPAWTPRPTPPGARRLSSRRSSSIHSSHRTTSLTTTAKSLLTTLSQALTSLLRHLLRLYLSLTPLQRILAFFASGILTTLAVLFLIYSHRVFAALGPLAASWRAAPFGWLPIWLATTATAFPPIVGYSTCVTAAGFVYGFPLGWPVAASATVCGSAAAFVASRGVLAGYVQRLVGRDRRFVALGQVLRKDGIGVLVMVRLCPLPYSLSNGFLGTVGRVGLGRFVLATAAATPKLLIHVFIGSRLALLADSGDVMSGLDRFVNYASMVVFGLLGFFVGLLIYRRTMARAEELAAGRGDLDEDGEIDPSRLEAGDPFLDGRRGGMGDEETVLDDDGDSENGRMVHPDDLDAAAIMDDDDISLWDTHGDGYHDSWDDDEGTTGNGNGVNGSGGKRK